MKNIHVLPTDKPSRLFKAGYYLYPNNELIVSRNPNCINQNIYITSDEEIKEGNFFLGANNVVYKFTSDDVKNGFKPKGKKIILTTDEDLIKDGVQAINEEFLEWFVKNQNYEYVEVEKYHVKGDISGKLHYKIIIPKEEPKQESCEYIKEVGCIKDICTCNTGPKQELNRLDDIEIEEMSNDWGTMSKQIESKQETLEEAAVNCWAEGAWDNRDDFTDGFIEGAKWQQERMYSEMNDYANYRLLIKKPLSPQEWFETFKNK